MPGKVRSSITRATLLLAVIAALPGAQTRLGGFDYRTLESHNRERVIMNVPPLYWDDKLAEGAQSWADYLARTGKFEHSPNIPGHPYEGENIWGGTAGAFYPEEMVDLWIDEKKAFIPGTFPANSSTGRVEDVSHYTQLIWTDTQRVGCAIAGGRDKEIMVCRYSNAGNIVGQEALSANTVS